MRGLSPRVRGHPDFSHRLSPFWGTIPAGAGTPATGALCNYTLWDYPRGCGDTPGKLSRVWRAMGTIPAGAGTPPDQPVAIASCWDYPRGCGDTGRNTNVGYTVEGLSPRVRGHPDCIWTATLELGTIPAGAGTPVTVRTVRNWQQDYPRGCGDTRHGSDRTQLAAGLSPRVRGHPPRW